MSSKVQLFLTVLLFSCVAVMANNCWQSTVTLHYSIGPSNSFTLQQSKADEVMNQVLNEAKRKLAACSGLTIQLLKVTIITTTASSPTYKIEGSYGIFYGNMDSTQKQNAFICIGNQQIYSEIIAYPELSTNSINGQSSGYPQSATMTNPQETTCVIYIPSSASTTIARTTLVSSFVSSTATSTAVPTWAPTTTTTTSAPTQTPTTGAVQLQVLKCYQTTVVLFYNISERISMAQLKPALTILTLVGISDTVLRQHSSCNNVQSGVKATSLTRDLLIGSTRVNASGVLVVNLTLDMTSSDDDDVASKMMTCAGHWSSSFIIVRNQSLPVQFGLFQYFDKIGVVYTHARSCCGAKPLPCCPGNAIQTSRDLCAHLSFVNFVNSKNATLDDRVVAICEVFTEADVYVSWSKDGSIISQSTAYSKRRVYPIDAVRTRDAGKYVCQVKNKFQVITRTMELKVIVTESVPMKLTLKTFTFHNDLRIRTSERYLKLEELVVNQITLGLSSKLNDIEKIVVNKFESGSVVVDFRVYVLAIVTSPSPSPPDLQKQVIDAMIEQTNSGSLGSLTVGSLVLEVKPPPPPSLSVTNLGPHSIDIKWQPPIGASSYQITQYSIRYFSPVHNPHAPIEDSVGSNNYSYILTGLKTNTKYEIQIVSVNAVDESLPSETLVATTLTVKPIIANNGQNFTVKEGQTVVLVCIGSSDPGPDKVTWSRKHDAAIVTTNTTNNGKIMNTYMIIRNVSVKDSGPYPCRASHGRDFKDGQVTLNVEVIAEVKMSLTLTNVNFTEKLSNKSTLEYKKLEVHFRTAVEDLNRNVTGFERVEVLGFDKGSVKVRFRVIVTVTITKPEQKGRTSVVKANATNRIITQVNNNNGLLGNGLSVRKDSIKTDAPPNPPRDVDVIDIKDTKAHVQWTKPLYAELFDVSHYQVMVKKHGDAFLWEGREETKLNQLDCPLENLHEGTGYRVKVVARSGQRIGVESNVKEFQTNESSVSLVWLWVIVSLAAVIIASGVAVYIYRCKHKRKRSSNRVVYDANANRASDMEFDRTRDDTPNVYSYANPGFSQLDIESLGIMPGKWWEIPRASVHLKETLGSGAFGMVCKAHVDLEDGYLTCAVKMLQKFASQEDQVELLKELQTMQTVGRHSNLINLIGACTINGPVMIVLEFAEKGNLSSYLKNSLRYSDGEQISSLLDNEKLSIGLDIAKGMRHLASVKCVHRDLAARNVLLSANGQAKIADFGLSRDVYEKGFYEKTTQGKLPVRWMAPEAILQMLFTTQSDVWSYGVVLWEIESGGKLPYSGLNMKELVNHLKKGLRLQRPANCRHEIFEIMLYCWHSLPAKRPSFDDLCLKMEDLLENHEPRLQSLTEGDTKKTTSTA